MLAPVRAAACSVVSMTVFAWPRQIRFSLPSVMPVFDARASALVAARIGSSHPAIASQATWWAKPGLSIPCGSNTPTGPSAARAVRVALRLSGFVDVVTTGPGASRIALIAMWRPFPEPGGPTTRMPRSTDAHTGWPLLAPSR